MEQKTIRLFRLPVKKNHRHTARTALRFITVFNLKSHTKCHNRSQIQQKVPLFSRTVAAYSAENNHIFLYNFYFFVFSFLSFFISPLTSYFFPMKFCREEVWPGFLSLSKVHVVPCRLFRARVCFSTLMAHPEFEEKRYRSSFTLFSD